MLTFNDVPETMFVLLQRMQGLENAVQQLLATLSLSRPQLEQPITQKELCKHLGISEQTAIRWKKRKKIPVIQNGSTVRYNLSEVLKALGK